jgi:hypothetical protein
MLSFRHTDIFVNEEIMLVCCSSKSSYSYALLFRIVLILGSDEEWGRWW